MPGSDALSVNNCAPESLAGGCAREEPPEIQKAPGRGNSADPVDELLGRFTTRSSRRLSRAAALIFFDGNTSDDGPFGAEATLIGVEGFTSGKLLS